MCNLNDNNFEYQVKINYNSGNSITRWYKSFEAEVVGERLSSYKATLCTGENSLIFVGAHNIESIEQVDIRFKQGS